MPKAAVLPELDVELEIMDLELDGPKAGEVRVRLAAAGVCHSDLSVQNGTLWSPTPIVLGHEGAGVVEEVGEGVEHLQPGDAVVLSWVPQDGTCFYCRRGQGELCEAGGAAILTGGLLDGTHRFHSHDGVPINQMSVTGAFAEQTVVPAISAVKIDPSMISLKTAALIGCGVLTGYGAAMNTADIDEGDTVAIVGCGGVGLNAIQGARDAGAERIIAVDMVPSKLDLAVQFGATDTVDVNDGDAVSMVLDLTEQRGVDVAFEVIGLPQTIEQAITMTRRGGQAIIVGVPKGDVMLEIPAFLGLVYNEKTIKGSWYGSSNVHSDIPALVSAYANGRLMLDELISREIALGDVNEAFRDLKTGEVARSLIVFS